MAWGASSPIMKTRKVNHFSATPQGIKARLVAVVSYADVNSHKDIILNGNVNKSGIYR